MCGIASCICHFNWLHLPYLVEVIAGFLFIFTVLEEIDLLVMADDFVYQMEESPSCPNILV